MKKRTITIEVRGTTTKKLEQATVAAVDKIMAGYKSCAGSNDDNSSRYIVVTTKEKKS